MSTGTLTKTPTGIVTRKQSPKAIALALLDAIEAADKPARLEWDRLVIRYMDMAPNDLVLALRNLPRE